MTTPNRRGRPRLETQQRSVDVHLVLPAVLYDKSFAAARVSRQSVNEWIRDRLRDATTRTARTENSAG